MNYLCLAVQREVAKSESGSREQAREYFRERFGDLVKARLEEEKKRLESRIRYYDRREERHKKEAGIAEECSGRREAALRELKRIESQMGEGQEGIQVWKYEEREEFGFAIPEQPGGRESVRMLRMAKVCRTGSSFQVVEEIWSCMIWRETGDRGIMEVRGRLPENTGERSVSLDICRESQETIEQFKRKLKRMRAEAKRNFCAGKDGEIYE